MNAAPSAPGALADVLGEGPQGKRSGRGKGKVSHALEQSFPIFPHTDSPGGCKDCGHQVPASRDTDIMDLGSSLGTGISFLKTENPCLRETVIGIQ